jgi:hypothetical protein
MSLMFLYALIEPVNSLTRRSLLVQGRFGFNLM